MSLEGFIGLFLAFLVIGSHPNELRKKEKSPEKNTVFTQQAFKIKELCMLFALLQYLRYSFNGLISSFGGVGDY